MVDLVGVMSEWVEVVIVEVEVPCPRGQVGHSL